MTRPLDVLTKEEITVLSRKSTARGLLAVLQSWTVIGLSFALVAWAPHPATIALALVLLGGQQLGLAVLMHEAAHRTLAQSRRWNDLCGRWLCGAPMGLWMTAYRKHHLGHHTHVGADRDPDRSLVAPFPTTKAGLVRKLARDVVGISGLRRVLGLLLMAAGYLEYTAASDAVRTSRRPQPTKALKNVVRRTWRFALANALLLGAMAALGHAELYLLWIGSYLTTFSLFLRIRSIAEHACLPAAGTTGPSDALRTRTTRAGWLARLTVAPHRVNFHVEHHLLMSAPFFRLPALHRLLVDRGYLAPRAVAPGYLEVLRRAATPSSAV